MRSVALRVSSSFTPWFAAAAAAAFTAAFDAALAAAYEAVICGLRILFDMLAWPQCSRRGWLRRGQGNEW